MSCTIEGLNELIEKLNVMDEKLTNRIAKNVIKEVAEDIKEDIKSVAPVSTERNIHGIDAIDVGKITKSKGYIGTKVGFSESIRAGGSGADYWTTVRGLWYQNFKTDEPNFGWYDKNIKSQKEQYRQALMDLLKIEITDILG